MADLFIQTKNAVKKYWYRYILCLMNFSIITIEPIKISGYNYEIHNILCYNLLLY